MNIIEKYNPQVGDEVTTNLDGPRAMRKTLTGIIGRIDDEYIYILNNTNEGSTYDGWRKDATMYEREYCWCIDVEPHSDCIFEILGQRNKFIKFLLRKK